MFLLNAQRVQLILIVIIIGIRTDYSFSQNGEYNVIRISRISYIHTPYGKVVNQLKIDIETNKIYFKKRPNRKFKEIHTTENISLFTDSLKINRVKEISKLNSESNEECRYHNEYGYFKIELIKLNGEDEIYGEMFLINNPYECKVEEDENMVRSYYDLIIALFNEN